MVNIADVVNNPYPHRLYMRASEEATQDSHGGWTATPAAWRLYGACREETNGKGSTVAIAGGKFTTFASVVYIPQGAGDRIPEGTEIIVADWGVELDTATLDDQDTVKALVLSGKVRVAGTCLKFDLGRLHSRLWL